MKTPTIALLLAALAAAPAYSLTTPVTPAPSPANDGSQPGKPALKVGMPADTILQLIGKPREVKSIVTEQGTGEAWIYRRVQNRWTQQTAAVVDMVPVWGGPTLDIVYVPTPSQRLENVVVYQFTALLMVDGKMVAAKQWAERDRSFE